MNVELKPDFDESYARHQAFWNREITDRPPVCIALEAPEIVAENEQAPRSYPSYREYWLDLPGRVEREVRRLENTEFLGDAMPISWPNMGPEIFSAWCGAGYEFGETTTWSIPIIEDWATDGPAARLDTEHPLFRASIELTELLIEAGRGRFIVGLPDFHPGGDHLAALRDPAQLAIDLIDQPDVIRPMIKQAADDFWFAYDAFYNRIHAAGMPATTWLPLLDFGRYYIPSNDFSGMISTEMFEEFFLDGIIAECRFLDRSIYHLDGPAALRHLDLILGISELDAMQFVPGAGNEDLERWMPIHQKIQAAGKAQHVLGVTTDNLDVLFLGLKPEGIFVSEVEGVTDRETALAVLKRFERWK
jgi:hypothetical protein